MTIPHAPATCTVNAGLPGPRGPTGPTGAGGTGPTGAGGTGPTGPSGGGSGFTPVYLSVSTSTIQDLAQNDKIVFDQVDNLSGITYDNLTGLGSVIADGVYLCNFMVNENYNGTTPGSYALYINGGFYSASLIGSADASAAGTVHLTQSVIVNLSAGDIIAIGNTSGNTVRIQGGNAANWALMKIADLPGP